MKLRLPFLSAFVMLTATVVLLAQQRDAKRGGDLRIQDHLQTGDVAPDFKLKTFDGKSEVQLSKLRDKPVVLLFGSYTCPPFRGEIPAFERLYERDKDKAYFFLTYIHEAHPTDGWVMEQNQREGINVTNPKSLDERKEVAATCSAKLKMNWPTLVDTMDDSTNQAYSAWPSRFYVIGTDGKILLKSRTGPSGFKANELDEFLQKHLVGRGARRVPTSLARRRAHAMRPTMGV